jgi:hypothetical protein
MLVIKDNAAHEIGKDCLRFITAIYSVCRYVTTFYCSLIDLIATLPAERALNLAESPSMVKTP